MTGYVLVCLGALALDALLGEPRRFHPLIGFGRLATAVEHRLNPAGRGGRLTGLLGLLVLVVPLVGLAVVIRWNLPGNAVLLFDALVVYLALGLRSLGDHARSVAEPLQAGELAQARQAVGRIVSRDSGALDEQEVAAAACESILENGADAVFATLFWYLVAGLPGVIVHRLINTLDAMWGYRNPRFEYFGWGAARLDDLLGWIPARLTALTYAVAGQTRQALACWRHQARNWSSPNAGPVMAAGAGALGLRLGGAASYHGQRRERPALGAGQTPDPNSPGRALTLVRRSVAIWLAIFLAGAAVWHWNTAAV